MTTETDIDLLAATAVSEITENGFTIVPAVLDSDEIAELDSAISSLEADHPLGRNVFEGEKSHRLYSLIARGRPFERLTAHPLALAVLDQMLLPNFLLSNCQSIRLYPGETQQPWHSDDLFYAVPRPHQSPLGISTIWALDAFTEENGATQLLPGSHRWGAEGPESHPEVIPVSAIMPAGSVLMFDAALWHRGGANNSDGTRLCMTTQFCQPWLRPQESQLLISPPNVARDYDERVRSMVGYSIHPPFIGQVEGKHPMRVIDEAGYRQAKGADSEIAVEMLASDSEVKLIEP